jgi:hypothetical protein
MAATDPKRSLLLKLQDLARVQAGYLCRTAVSTDPEGTHLLLQARDVSRVHGLRLEGAVRFKPERNADLYRVSRGDILLVARGQDHRACLIDADIPDVLASSVFYIIRPREDAVLPGYLAWWLNQPDTQALLDSASSGTGIGFIARPLLEQLAVVVPPFNVQRRIVKITSLRQQQQVIQDRIDQKHEQLIRAVCRQAIGLEKGMNS